MPKKIMVYMNRRYKKRKHIKLTVRHIRGLLTLFLFKNSIKIGSSNKLLVILLTNKLCIFTNLSTILKSSRNIV